MKEVIFLSVMLLLASRSHAGPPLLTDDTGTPGPNRWEVNIGISTEIARDEDRFLIPLLDLNYGVGHRIQLKYEVPWVVLHQSDDSIIAGPGNSVVGMKYRFLDEEKSGIALSVYPQLEFNTSTSSAHRGLVEKGSAWFLPLELDKKVGWFNLNLEVGFLSGPDERVWVYGLVIGHKFKRLETLVEIHGEGLKDFQRHHVLYNFGFRYDLTKRFTVDGSIGSSFSPGTNRNPYLINYIGMEMHL